MNGIKTVASVSKALLLQTTVETATEILTQLLGLAILAGTLAAVAALAYRWYTRERVPRILPLLVGLAGIAVYLNASTAIGQTVLDTITPTEEALLNIVAFLFGAGGALAGRRAGDRFGTDVVLEQTTQQVSEDVGQLVQSIGQVTIVELPTEIGDVVGYDPVPDPTRDALEGKRFVFPGNTTVSELHDRLGSRIKEDYAVGHVALELAADGSVEHIALGSRAAGIGPTLPPATNAVAIRADPAFSASAGDLVQVWETDPMRRVLTGELRGVADDVVTIAIDASDTPKVDPTREYRLVTLPVDDRPEREFASLLRGAPETFSSVTVEAGSPLHGMPAGALDIAVIAIKPEGAESKALPEPSTLLAPGDTVFAIAPPEALRRLQTAAEPLDPSLVRGVGRPSVSTDETASETGGANADDQPELATDKNEGGLAADSEATSSQSADSAGEDTDTSAGADDGLTADADSSEFDDEASTAGGDTDIAEAGGDAGETTAEADSASAERSEVTSSGTSSFDELKEEFESGDADWEEDDGSGVDEPTTGDTDTAPPAETGESTESSGGSTTSFQDLKAEFESGEADWDEDESPAETEAAEGLDDIELSDEPEPSDAEMDDLDGLELDDDTEDGPVDDTEEPFADDGLDELAVEDEDGLDDESDEADDLSELSFEDEDGADDLSDLTFDEDESEDLFGDDDDPFDGETTEQEPEEKDDEEETDDADDNDGDDDDDDDGGGGGTSFQQLKEEFESGDADWEDDISDSPGGDMRLDE